MKKESPSEESQPLNLGIIGLGDVHRWHADALSRTPFIRVVSAFDSNPERNSILEDVRVYSNLAELLSTDSIEAALVAVSTPNHFSVAREFLTQGTHVLLEKPATMSQEQLAQLYDLADKTSARLVIAFHDTYGSELLTFLDSVHGDMVTSFGQATYFRSEFRDPYVHDGTARVRAKSLVGSWFDSGVNALSILCSVWSGLEVADADFFWVSEDNSYDTRARVSLRSITENSPAGIIETDWTTPKKEKRTIIEYGLGDTRIILNHSERTIIKITREGQFELFRSEGSIPRLTEQYIRVFGSFYSQIHENKDNRGFAKRIHDLLFSAMLGPKRRMR